jgi:hypothetical protein
MVGNKFSLLAHFVLNAGDRFWIEMGKSLHILFLGALEHVAKNVTV